MSKLITLANQLLRNALPYCVQTQQKMAMMEDESCKWVATDLGITVVFMVRQGVLVVSDQNQPTQATIMASSKQLLDLAQQGEDAYDSAIEISGNPLVMKRFFELFKEVDFDIEQLCRDVFGDFTGQMLSRVGRSAKQQLSWKLQRLRQDMHAYKNDERDA